VKAFIPNLLCLSRIGFALLLAAFPADAWVMSLFALYVFASDSLDGILARRWNVASAFGASLDHVSDKIVVLFFAFDLALHHELPLVVAFLLTLRDYVSDMFKSYAHRIGKDLPVSKFAKYKSALFFIWLILVYGHLHSSGRTTSELISTGALGILLLSYASLVDYGRKLWSSRVQAEIR
jgi:phosphatidylglycerophosphate synthase